MSPVPVIDDATTIATQLCQENADYVLAIARDRWSTSAFDETGVEWLDGHIEASRQHLGDDLADEFVQLMGSFYGQCLLETFGGRWTLTDGKLAIWSDPHGFTYPFEAVRRQLTTSDAPSVSTRYRAAAAAMADRVEGSAAA